MLHPLKRIFGALALAGALTLGTGAVAAAQYISLQDAQRIALYHVPGTVIDIELDDGKWEVEICATDGRVHEVKINARTGHVIEIEVDDDVCRR